MEAALAWVPSRYSLSEGEPRPLVIRIVPGMADVCTQRARCLLFMVMLSKVLVSQQALKADRAGGW